MIKYETFLRHESEHLGNVQLTNETIYDIRCFSQDQHIMNNIYPLCHLLGLYFSRSAHLLNNVPALFFKMAPFLFQFLPHLLPQIKHPFFSPHFLW